MSLLAVNAHGPGLCLDPAALTAAIEALPPAAPIVAMIHGYRFSPGKGRHCPHDHILSFTPAPGDRKAVSWPRHLRLGAPDAGLAIAFGWRARGSIWAAHAEAAQAARALAGLAALVRRIDPHRPIDVIAHSLGARVVLSALPQVDAGSFGRIILMAAAEFRDQAEAAVHSPAGRQADIVNVTSRENDMFDFCMETLLSGGLDCSIGHGLANSHANWFDLQIDRPEVLAALASLGYRLAPTRNRVCHWSPYLRPGLFALYRALLTRQISPALLRAHLPTGQEARWSRLIRASLPRLPLPGNPA